MAEEETNKYVRQMSILEEERRTWDARNRDISDYILPGRGKYSTSGDTANDGSRKDEKIINEVAMYAMRIPIAGMISGLSSPASEWFRLGIEDKDLEKYGPVKEWLEIVRQGLRSIYQKSNFYTALYVIYEEEIGFGTGVVIGEYDEETVIRYRVMTAGEYVLSTNDKGLIDTLGRRFHMTAGQMISKFGKGKVSESVRSIVDKNPYKWFEVIHFIEPNTERDDRKIDNLNMPFRSVYVEKGQSDFLSKSGYEEQPMMAPRWKVTAQRVYGDGLGNETLGSTMMLQELDKESLKALYKMVDPPVVGDPSFTHTLDISAGGFNPSPSGGQGGDQLKALYDIDFNIDHVEKKITRVEQQIGRGFFNDLFLYLHQNPNATATEILEKKAEKVMLLGPVITRQQDELYDPLFQRTFGIANRAGYFPLPPPELEGHELEIEYISQLAIAQRMAGVTGIYDYLGFIGEAAAIQPEIVDKFDGDEAADAVAEKLGVPPKVNPGEEIVAEKRQARQEAQAKAQQTDEIMTAIEGAKGLSQAKLDDKNALGELLKGGEE